MSWTPSALVLAAVLLLGVGPVRAEGLLNLSCMEALAAVGEEDLAGIFSFINEDDSTVAFADLSVRRRGTLRKYLNKISEDFRIAQGISSWDHQVVLRILQIYGSPLAETLRKPSNGALKKLKKFSLAKTLTLEELSRKRREA